MRIKRIWKAKTKRGAIWGLCVGLVNSAVNTVAIVLFLPHVKSLLGAIIVPVALVSNVFSLATITVALYNIAKD